MITLTVLIAIPVGFYAGLRDPFIQTFIARSAAAYLSAQFGSEIRIGAFYIDLDLSLKLDDVYVGDHHGNTLLRAESIKMRPRSYEFRNGFYVRDLSIQGIEFQLIKYVNETDLNLLFITDFFRRNDSLENNRSVKKDYPFRVQTFNLKRASFRYWDQNKDKPGELGMDYGHLNFSDIDLKISNIFYVSDSISCNIERLTALDTSGMHLKDMRGDFQLSSKRMGFANFHSVVNNSTLNLEIDFKYNSYASYLDFIDSVEMNVLAHPSSLQMADIGYFAPVMFDMTNTISFAGDFSGPVSDLSAQGLSFSFGRSTVFAGDVKLTGLPDVYETFADLSIRRFETEIFDLQRFALAGAMRYLPFPDEIISLGEIRINGLFKGFYNNFHTNSEVSTSLGRIKSNLELRQNKNTAMFHYAGRLEANRLDVGKLLNVSETLGKLDMNMVINGKGLTVESADMNLSGVLKEIEFKGNHFKDIELAGDLTGKAFNGSVNIDDPKLKLVFLGRANFADTLPAFDFGATITHADLYNLHLLDQDTLMHLKTNINVNFVGLEPDNLVGSIQIDSTTYTDSRDSYAMEQMLIMTTHQGLYPRRLTIASDFFDLDLGGAFDFANFTEAFKQFVSNYVQFRNFEPKTDSIYLQDFFIDLQFKDTETLSKLFMPALNLAPNASFSGVFTNRDHVLNTTFRANQLAFGNVKINQMILNSQSDYWQANFQMTGRDIIFRDSVPGDPTILGVDRPEFSASLANDSVTFRLQWNDERTIARNRGDVKGYYAAFPDEPHELRVSSADLVVNDSIWRISRGNRIIFADAYTRIKDFHIRLRNQSISLEGKIPLSDADSLNIVFDNWDISNFDLLTQGSGLDFDGFISGELMLASLRNKPAFVSNLQLSELYLNRERLGDARLLSTWSDLEEVLYLNAQIINVGNITTSRMLNLRGFYYPTRDENSLNAELGLENFRVKAIAPFLDGVLSKIEGLATGDLNIAGTLSKPEITGSVNLMRTAFLIDYLNVKYSLSHEFEILPNRINFKDLILYDTMGKRAMVNGAISHNYFKDFRFNLSVRPEDFLALNTNRSMNELFYGSAVVSGDVQISGALNNVGLNIKTITRRGTNITIPLASATTVYDNDFIVFLRDPDDDTEAVEEQKSQIRGFNINLEAAVTPDANLMIFLPANMGNLESTGSGNIKLGVNSAGDFSLQGDYFVQAGKFNFMFENLVRRRFELLQGGRISWTGDPYDADIDIKGLYRLKTSISTLGPGIDSTRRSRINVEAIIHLTEQLFNPTIKFSIRLPNVDTETRQMVFSVLDTTNDAMMTQQILSLLVLGSFSYTGGETASLGASSISMISNQLSNWLSQISRDFDIGLHYKPGDKLSNEELEVALSTQLFHDRVTIDGNFGVIGNRHSSQNASNIVGDVDIIVMLTPDGRLRMKAFNHSNTSIWFSSRAYDNFVPYTQGIGLSYRQDFDNFGDLLRRRKKKQPEQ